MPLSFSIFSIKKKLKKFSGVRKSESILCRPTCNLDYENSDNKFHHLVRYFTKMKFNLVKSYYFSFLRLRHSFY